MMLRRPEGLEPRPGPTLSAALTLDIHMTNELNTRQVLARACVKRADNKHRFISRAERNRKYKKIWLYPALFFSTAKIKWTFMQGVAAAATAAAAAAAGEYNHHHLLALNYQQKNPWLS